jgi:hypothetical protein
VRVSGVKYEDCSIPLEPFRIRLTLEDESGGIAQAAEKPRTPLMFRVGSDQTAYRDSAFCMKQMR